MAQIENLSAVGRELFFNGLSNLDAPLYFSEKDFDKDSAIKISAKEMQFESGTLVFSKGLGLEKLLDKSFNMFFVVSSCGYFCSVEKIVSRGENLVFPVPKSIKKIPAQEEKKATEVEGRVYYRSKDSTVELTLNARGEISKVHNICGQLCREKDFTISSGPLDLVFISQDFIIFSSGDKKILQENQIYLVDLSFKISPVLKRKITLGCVVMEGTKKHCYCHLCKITHAKEEDKRFLGRLGSRT